MITETTEPSTSRYRDSHSPRLRVGLPVFNGARFLEETLDSVLAQTFEDFEVIVSDNASVDATPDIVRHFSKIDSRIRYECFEHNVGAARNFNHVASSCRSEYFKWVAADDPCAPTFFQACIDALDADREASAAFPQAVFIDENSRVLYGYGDVVTLPTWSPIRVTRYRQVIDALLEHGSSANVMIFGVIRTNVLSRTGLIGNYFGSDLPLVAELAGAGKLIEIAEPLSFFRRHEQSSSSYARSPSARAQQDFYDPSVAGDWRLQWNLRRRYVELLRVVIDSPFSITERAYLLGAVLAAVGRRLGRRVRFEWDVCHESPPPPPQWYANRDEALHWTEFAAMPNRPSLSLGSRT